MLVGANGKPITSYDMVVVQITIAHKKAGKPGTAKYPILVAEVDGDLKTTRAVLQAALGKTLTKLRQLGAMQEKAL